MRVRIDWDLHEIDTHELSGMEILRLAGKAPSTHELLMRVVGGGVRIEPDAVVRLNSRIVRFQTLPRARA